MSTSTKDHLANLAIFSNVILWSTFPIFSYLAIGLDPFSILLYSQIVAAVIAFFLSSRPAFQELKERFFAQWMFYLASALASAALMLLFFVSIRLITGTISTVLLELWPIAAFFLVNKFANKTPEKITPPIIFALSLGALGLFFAVRPMLAQHGMGSEDDLVSYSGIVLALLAAIASAFTVLQSRLARPPNGEISMKEAMTVVFIIRLITIPFSAFAALAFGGNVFDLETFAIGGLLGVVCFLFASALAIYGIRNTNSAKSTFLWFLTPPLSVVWLAIFFNEVLYSSVVIGLMLLLLSNIILNNIELRRLSSIIAIVALLVCTIFVAQFSGFESKEYYNALFVLISFFSIFSGLMINRRLESKIRDINDIIDFANNNASFMSKIKSSDKPSEELIAKCEEFGKILLSCRIRERLSSARNEFITCAILATAIIFIAVFFRENTLLASVISIAVVYSVVFIFLYAHEVPLNDKERAEILLLYAKGDDETKSVKAWLFGVVIIGLMASASLLIYNRYVEKILSG